MAISQFLSKKTNVKRFKKMQQEKDNLTVHERMHEFMQLHGSDHILPYLDKLDKARLCQGKSISP